jgi:hypothetical protein
MISAVADIVDEVRASSLVRRIEAEFEEMPGLSLSLDQACRLFGLDAWRCERVLEALAADGFLVRNVRGQYRRCG